MPTQFPLVFTIATVSLLLPTLGIAEEFLLCVRGKSFESGREFLQTRSLKFTANGPPLGEFLPTMARHAVREKLWPELKPEEIHVIAFDSSTCGNEPTAELTVRYEAKDLLAIEVERRRGPSEQKHLKDVASRSVARPAHPKAPPVGTVAEARRHDWMQLFFATTRQPTGEKRATSAFGKARSDALSFGTVEVSIPADPRWANLESPSLVRLEWDADPKRHIVLAGTLQILPAGAWKVEVARRAAAFDKGGVLLFVHGYRTSFSEASQRAAQLAYDLAFPGPTVLFSWPSDGDLLPYTRDEEKARTAWRPMAEVLDQLSRLGQGVPIYVIAHSMGTRVLTQGLAELLRQRPGADRAFRQVVLASPDIGEEEFRQRWIYELNSANPPRFTLYASQQDVPVAISAWLHGERRLGSGGPDIAVLPPMESVDASRITKEWFGLSHSYFGDNETVLSDLFLVIHHGLEADRRPRLNKVQGNRGVYWEFRP